MGPMGRPGLGGYPVNLLLDGRRCLVVGAGRVAARKIAGLLEAGADVHVVAPTVSSEVQTWADAGQIHVEARRFEPADVDDTWLVTVATPHAAVNAAVADAASARRVFVNSADDPAHCTFTLMSVVRQGDVVVTIGTGGRSPALAAYLKDHVAAELGPEWATLVELLSDERERLRAGGTATETVDWKRALDSGMLDLVRAGRVAEAKELLRACLLPSSG